MINLIVMSRNSFEKNHSTIFKLFHCNAHYSEEASQNWVQLFTHIDQWIQALYACHGLGKLFEQRRLCGGLPIIRTQLVCHRFHRINKLCVYRSWCRIYSERKEAMKRGRNSTLVSPYLAWYSDRFSVCHFDPLSCTLLVKLPKRIGAVWRTVLQINKAWNMIFPCHKSIPTL